MLRKVRSHQRYDLATTPTQRLDIQGNDYADIAAVQARKIDKPEIHKLFADIENWNQAQVRQSHAVLQYLHDLNLAHIVLKESRKDKAAEPDHEDPTQNWGTIHHLRSNLRLCNPIIMPVLSIHPHVFTACLWGAGVSIH